MASAPQIVLLGLPRSVTWLVWVPLLALPALVALIVTLVRLWLAGSTSLVTRLHLTGVATAAAALLVVLFAYGVIGPG